MAAAPFIDHRPFRVLAHPRGAHQVPSAVADGLFESHIIGAGGPQNLGATLHREVQHAPAVLAECVVDPGRRDAVGVFQHGVQRDGVMLLREVLADRDHAGAVAKKLAIGVVVRLPPGDAARCHAGYGGHHGALAADEFERPAAHEAAAEVGFVELLAPDAVVRAAVAIHFLIEITVDLGVRVEHEVLADKAAGIGDAVGKFRGLGVQQNARRADTVAGHDHDLGRLEHLFVIGVVIDGAGGHALFVDRDFPHPAARPDFDARPDRLRPIGDVGAGLGPLRAAGGAMTEVDALGPPLIIRGGDGAVGGPPVPAQLVQAAGQRHAGRAQRQRRHHRLLRRIGGVAGQPGHAGHAVVLRIKRLQRLIVDRPVVADSVERLHPEVGRMEARVMPGVQHRAAADTVEVGDFDGRVVLADRIVGRAGAAVRADAEIAKLAGFPVAAGGGVFGGFGPVPLLQADDAHARFGEAPGHGGPGGARADDQDVDFIRHGGVSLGFGAGSRWR